MDNRRNKRLKYEGLIEQEKWQQKFYELVLFQSKNNGSSIVPNDTADHRTLAEWVRKERILYKQFIKSDGLPPWIDREQYADHVAALKQIGFVFEAKTGNMARCSDGKVAAHWNAKYDELIKYIRENNGDCNPGVKTACGPWLNLQRLAHREYKFHLERHRRKYPHHRELLAEEMPRRKRSTDPKEEGMYHAITNERIHKLNAIDGFQWDLAPQWTPFEQRLGEYKQYCEEQGHGFIPQHYEKNPQLGKWVSKMRYEHSLLNKGEKSQMTSERIRILESVGFEFSNQRRSIAKETPGEENDDCSGSIAKEIPDEENDDCPG